MTSIQSKTKTKDWNVAFRTLKRHHACIECSKRRRFLFDPQMTVKIYSLFSKFIYLFISKIKFKVLKLSFLFIQFLRKFLIFLVLNLSLN
jgi:hypothetical protein